MILIRYFYFYFLWIYSWVVDLLLTWFPHVKDKSGNFFFVVRELLGNFTWSQVWESYLTSYFYLYLKPQITRNNHSFFALCVHDFYISFCFALCFLCVSEYCVSEFIYAVCHWLKLWNFFPVLQIFLVWYTMYNYCLNGVRCCTMCSTPLNVCVGHLGRNFTFQIPKIMWFLGEMNWYNSIFTGTNESTQTLGSIEWYSSDPSTSLYFTLKTFLLNSFKSNISDIS